MADRSVFAEIQHESKLASAKRSKLDRALAKAEKRAKKAQKAADRAWDAASDAAVPAQKRLDAEARTAHIAAMEADAEASNAWLAALYGDVDSILATTLLIDGTVDLESLRMTVEHPPVSHADLEEPTPEPATIPEPPEPQYEAPSSVGWGFNIKKKKAAAEAAARADHEARLKQWRMDLEALPARRAAAIEQFKAEEQERVDALAKARAVEDRERDEREAEVERHNNALDALIANLGYGTPEAIEEFVSIIVANSLYPEHFEAEHDFSFDPAGAELDLRVTIPAPEAIQTIKSFKYVKSADEVKSSELSQKAVKDRYSGAVHQVALRSMHEIFESDARGLIKAISLQVGVEAPDPATGNIGFIPLAAVAAEREAFQAIDLALVVPAATLEHLGASLSKNPVALQAADITGIRGS